MENQEILSEVLRLIQTLEDGREGYQEAAAASKIPDLVTLFSNYSAQRDEFSVQLQTVGSQYGDTAYDQGSSIAGAMHRGWIDLKAALSSSEAHAVLAECERGEDHAVSEFEKVLETDLPANVREVVAYQAAEVKTAHDEIKRLRDLAKAAHE